MLRGNLSSRPFYNERLVTLLIIVVALATAALTAFNASRIYALTRQRGELKARIARDTAQAQEIERQAVAVQRNINRTTLAQLAVSTQEANALIDQRTFSWTEFFGLLERTLPMDLHLVAVTPRVEKGNVRVTINVVAKKLDDIDAFVEALHETGAFYDLLARNTERNEDDNTFRGDVIAYYLAPNRGAAPSSTAPATTGSGR